MKLSDYVVQTLIEDYGVRDIFLVSGGGIMHLLDSVGSHAGVRYYCTYHEQAAVVAAEGYARRTGKLGVALVTVGPGAANAVSALPGAWVDSVPVLVLAGQVRSDLIADYRTQRQRGPQEANTLDMARPVTKYAASLRDAKSVRQELDRAIAAATGGRPGPAWLEFPVDVTALDVDPKTLEGWKPEPAAYEDAATIAASADAVIEALGAAQRPLIVARNGIAYARSAFLEFVEASGIPVVVPLPARTCCRRSSALPRRVFGTAGQRRANLPYKCRRAARPRRRVQRTKVGYNVAASRRTPRKSWSISTTSNCTSRSSSQTCRCWPTCTFLPAPTERVRARQGAVAALDASMRGVEAADPLITPDYREDDAHVNSYVFMDELERNARRRHAGRGWPRCRQRVSSVPRKGEQRAAQRLGPMVGPSMRRRGRGGDRKRVITWRATAACNGTSRSCSPCSVTRCR